MIMTKEDIIKEYREAAVPSKQITILADLNMCSKQEIADILIEGGCDVPDWYTKDKAPKKAPEKKEEKAVAKEKSGVVYDGKGNVTIPMEEWLQVLRDRLHLEHIMSQGSDAVGILIAVDAVRTVREVKA